MFCFAPPSAPLVRARAAAGAEYFFVAVQEKVTAPSDATLDPEATDGAPAAPLDPEVGSEVAAMISVHAAAQLEHVRNAMVLAKRPGRGRPARVPRGSSVSRLECGPLPPHPLQDMHTHMCIYIYT